MGYEFVFRLPSGPVATAKAKADTAEQVFTCLEQALLAAGPLLEIARTGASRSYAFAAPLRSHWPEDFVVMVDSEEWYLNFHAATGAQQALILQTLTQCLHTAGLGGKFEEL